MNGVVNGKPNVSLNGQVNGKVQADPASQQNGLLGVDAITIRYGQREVVRGVSLEVQAGEVLALIGSNGAGKSTLIRAASGVLPPVRGRVLALGKEMHRLSPEERARRVAVVPQAVHLPEAFTVLDTVLMGRTAYLGWLGREGEADRQIACRAMEATCTAELAGRPIGELSGGEQQRVLIARALAQSAPILLMDEPTAHLDLRHQAAILGLVRNLAHQQRFAVLVALHDLNLAAQYADRIALLSGGELWALGTPERVLTADQLSRAYGMSIRIYPHPALDRPLVVPASWE